MSIVDFDEPPYWSPDFDRANWGEYKMPVGRGVGGHSRRKIINSISSTHGHFVLSPVSLASRHRESCPVELNDQYLRYHGKLGELFTIYALIPFP